MIHLVKAVPYQVYEIDTKVIGLVMMILTPTVTMTFIMMENGGDIRNKP